MESCDTCGGVFAAIGDFREVAHGAAPDSTDPRVLACPRCAAEMERRWVPRGAVFVDVCAGHGVWFDALEIDLIALGAGACESASEPAQKLFAALNAWFERSIL